MTAVNDKFGVADSISHLQNMMRGVTAKEFNASTVNAAVGCVSQINETIRTAIQAAKFLAEK